MSTEKIPLLGEGRVRVREFLSQKYSAHIINFGCLVFVWELNQEVAKQHGGKNPKGNIDKEDEAP